MMSLLMKSISSRGYSFKAIQQLLSPILAINPGIIYHMDKLPQLVRSLSFRQIKEIPRLSKIFIIFLIIIS